MLKTLESLDYLWKSSSEAQKNGRPSRQVPGRIGQLPGQSPHRSVREGFPHTVPQA
jgi:hypothetical protein